MAGKKTITLEEHEAFLVKAVQEAKAEVWLEVMRLILSFVSSKIVSQLVKENDVAKHIGKMLDLAVKETKLYTDVNDDHDPVTKAGRSLARSRGQH